MAWNVGRFLVFILLFYPLYALYLPNYSSLHIKRVYWWQNLKEITNIINKVRRFIYFYFLSTKIESHTSFKYMNKIIWAFFFFLQSRGLKNKIKFETTEHFSSSSSYVEHWPVFPYHHYTVHFSFCMYKTYSLFLALFFFTGFFKFFINKIPGNALNFQLKWWVELHTGVL